MSVHVFINWSIFEREFLNFSLDDASKMMCEHHFNFLIDCNVRSYEYKRKFLYDTFIYEKFFFF